MITLSSDNPLRFRRMQDALDIGLATGQLMRPAADDDFVIC